MPAAAAAQGETLLAADQRLAAVAEPLQRANAPLCDAAMPLTGMVLHSADQYPAGTAGFADGPVAIAAVVPGSPAHAAGLVAGDTVVAIAGVALAALPAPPDAPLRDAAFERLAQQRPEHPLTFALHQNGVERQATLTAPPGCRVLVEVVTRPGLRAISDGRVIQLSRGMLAALDDGQLAVIFAHELAHLVLRHRARLEAAGNRRGLARLAEEEADRLTPHLLARAGHDPALATALWRSPQGRRIAGGLLRARSHPAPSVRAAMIEAEIAQHLSTGPAQLLARRDQPLAEPQGSD